MHAFVFCFTLNVHRAFLNVGLEVTLGIRVEVVLHVFQGFVLFPFGLLSLSGLFLFCWCAFSCLCVRLSWASSGLF